MLDWDSLVLKEGEKILNYVNKIVGQIDNSKDIVQDTFLACYQNIDRIDPDFILPYLYKVAHNKAINFVKKNQRLVYGHLPELVHHDRTEEELRKENLEKAVRACFQKMKPRYSMVLELQYYQKKSYKEISDLTGMSVSAVESVLVRAKKECKKILQVFKDTGVL
ncbi:MAG: RNA polymerase sigma factor [Candidatus Cloacimonetes bacterium]|nr:RNA polymerase sigma factor [Candidatus Cloacimonadota bacterium]